MNIKKIILSMVGLSILRTLHLQAMPFSSAGINDRRVRLGSRKQVVCDKESLIQYSTVTSKFNSEEKNTFLHFVDDAENCKDKEKAIGHLSKLKANLAKVFSRDFFKECKKILSISFFLKKLNAECAPKSTIEESLVTKSDIIEITQATDASAVTSLINFSSDLIGTEISSSGAIRTTDTSATHLMSSSNDPILTEINSFETTQTTTDVPSTETHLMSSSNNPILTEVNSSEATQTTTDVPSTETHLISSSSDPIVREVNSSETTQTTDASPTVAHLISSSNNPILTEINTSETTQSTTEVSSTETHLISSYSDPVVTEAGFFETARTTDELSTEINLISSTHDQIVIENSSPKETQIAKISPVPNNRIGPTGEGTAPAKPTIPTTTPSMSEKATTLSPPINKTKENNNLYWQLAWMALLPIIFLMLCQKKIRNYTQRGFYRLPENNLLSYDPKSIEAESTEAKSTDLALHTLKNNVFI